MKVYPVKMRLYNLFLILCFVNICSAETLNGRVVSIADGDTITVLDSSNKQYKIRLSGIDAPEKSQPFGKVSKTNLSGLIYEKNVSVEYYKSDRYGRLVGKVLLDNFDINLEQIKVGMAWHYSKYQKEQPFNDRLTYVQAQQDAKRERIGLWVDNNATAPWEFRKVSKTK